MKVVRSNFELKYVKYNALGHLFRWQDFWKRKQVLISYPPFIMGLYFRITIYTWAAYHGLLDAEKFIDDFPTRRKLFVILHAKIEDFGDTLWTSLSFPVKLRFIVVMTIQIRGYWILSKRDHLSQLFSCLGIIFGNSLHVKGLLMYLKITLLEGFVIKELLILFYNLFFRRFEFFHIGSIW